MLTVDRTVVADRKKHPNEKKDLLDVMLNGRDKETGEGLSDENIAHNVRALSLTLTCLLFALPGHLC